MKTLKKYPNRRIYDCDESRYITLADVKEMVLRYVPFKVVQSKSGKDVTRATLLQIISELEDDGHESLLTNRMLEEHIRFYGDHMAHVMGPLIEKELVAFLKHHDAMRAQYMAGITGAAQSGLFDSPLDLNALLASLRPDLKNTTS